MDNILLLHGALGSKATFTALEQTLQAKYNVHTLDFTGHGGLALPQEPYSMSLFTEDILALLDSKGLHQAHIFGYSMGGYAALYFALEHPERVSSIFTMATKFDWSPATAAHEGKMLNPEKIEEKVPQFAKILAERHYPQDWKQVVSKTAEMMQHLGSSPTLTSDNLSMLAIPVQLSVGDRDNMVTVEETLGAYKLLPNAKLLVLPDTGHPFEKVPVNRLAYEIEHFINTVAQ
jgi:pimeloyl-ACP methyl ester carboxylesterase